MTGHRPFAELRSAVTRDRSRPLHVQRYVHRSGALSWGYKHRGCNLTPQYGFRDQPEALDAAYEHLRRCAEATVRRLSRDVA